MGRLRRLAVVFALVATAMVSGSGAFTSASADRQVQVTVVDDDNAMLGVQTHDQALPNGKREATLLTLSNRFSTPLTDVSVTVTDDRSSTRPTLRSRTHVRELKTGETKSVTAEVQCKPHEAEDGRSNTEHWTVHVSASGRGVSVETTRSVSVTCTGHGKGQGGDS